MVNVLIVTAVDLEKVAVQQGLLRAPDSSIQFHTETVGVGPVAAAVGTMAALHCWASKGTAYPDVIICAGIAGQYVNDITESADYGKLIVGSQIVAADLGAETDNEYGFTPLTSLGFGVHQYSADLHWCQRLATELNCEMGQIMTVSTVTGSAATSQTILRRYPAARAEAMEGFGVAAAAATYAIPFVEIRAISNLVGVRQRDCWRIDVALTALEQAFEKIGRW